MKTFAQVMIGACLFVFVVTLPLHCARADHIVLSFGPTLNGNTNPKHASVGYEYLFGEASLLSECRGIFSESLNGACELVLSERVVTHSGLFMRLGAGPAWYFREDDRVSSHFNFNLQGAIGLSQDGWELGVVYAHYSNAGLWGQNLGRDFIGALLVFRIGQPPRQSDFTRARGGPDILAERAVLP